MEDPVVVEEESRRQAPSHPSVATHRPAKQVLDVLRENGDLDEEYRNWYLTVQDWTDEELNLVIQAAKKNTQTCSLQLDLRRFRDGQDRFKSATRAAQVASSFDSLCHFGIVYEEGDDDGGGGDGDDDQIGRLADCILREMGSGHESSSTTRAKLESFQLDYFGKSSAWLSFVDRYPSIEELQIGDCDSDSPCSLNLTRSVTTALAVGFSRLPHLRGVHLCIRVSGNDSTTLLHGLVAVPSLADVNLTLYPSDDSHTTYLQSAVNNVAIICALCKNLKNLRLEIRDEEDDFDNDYTILFEQALFSRSLESLRLVSVNFSQGQFPTDEETELGVNEDTKNRPRNEPTEIVTNQSLKDISFLWCRVGGSSFELLSRFTNLVSIKIEDSFGRHRPPHSWTRLFRDLKGLEQFRETMMREPSDAVISRDSSFSAIASGLEANESLQDLQLASWAGYASDDGEYHGEPLFPSLTTLLTSCKASLTLIHRGRCDDNIGFFCAGLEGTLALTQLKLEMFEDLSFPSIVQLLRALKRNSSIHTFTGTFCVAASFDPALYSADLVDVMTLNSTLKSFSLEVYVGNGDYAAGGELVTHRLIAFITTGLSSNRALERLALPMHHNVTTATPFVEMLQENTTLQHLEGLNWVTKSDKQEIDWFLTLNRYNRRLLVHPETALPRSGWPRVLGKIVRDDRMDVLHHFVKVLHTRPSLLLLGSRGRGIRRPRRPIAADPVADEP